MKNKLAVMIPVIESERGWGRKVDDHMVCLTTEDTRAFEKEFNSKNQADSTPEWYMQVEGEPITVDITESQMKYLVKNKRVWLSELKKL